MNMTPLSALLFLLVICDVWSPSEGKRVLVFPMPYTSHTKYHINVAQELVKLGHKVWLTMPGFIRARGLLDTSNLTVVEYSPPENIEEKSMSWLRDKYFSGEEDDFLGLIQSMKDFCDLILGNETFFGEMRNIGFEFVVIDNVLLKKMSVLPYRLGVPFAFLGSAYDAISQRVPFSPAVSPIPLFPFSDRMKFTERLQNSLVYLISGIVKYFEEADLSKFAPEMPYVALDMLYARAEIWLVETDHVLDYPRPSLPNVKLIGGTATGPAKPLPPKFQSFMDSATQGVIIVSFGSYVLNLPKDISDKVVQMLLQIPLKSVFRSNLSSPDPGKIFLSPWIPQNDLLGHHNTKVFFSHCGKNGQYEALYHAVPIVASPMFSDQAYNAERIRIKGFSETVDVKTMTADELSKTVMQVASEKRYKQSISKASELFRIEFGVPKERAAFWLDHVMKYGGGHMRAAGQDMPYYQFLGLDVIMFITVSIFLITFLFTTCCWLNVKWLCCRKRKQKEE